ncbi:MAG: branched-chain amino acid ABC transporter permease [Stellaceae bacterium]
MSNFLTTWGALTFDGVSFGMILFLISSGLTVTLGVMRLVNLAHCGFAMIGGYMSLALVTYLGLGLLGSLPLAVIGTMIVAIVIERTLFRWVYGISELGQILMTIGLAFVMVSIANFTFGPLLYTLPVPKWLAGNLNLAGVVVSSYRIFLVAVSGVIAIAIWYVVEQTDFGAQLRAAVDNPRMARCAGINVKRIFTVTFTAGCGLAAVGGILGTQMLPVEPNYALEYLILVLIVVATGGLGSLKGSFTAALVIGIVDTYGRYLLPVGGGFVMYALMLVLLLARPQGLFARA